MNDPITLFTSHAQFEAALLNLEWRSVLRGIIDEYFQYLTLRMKSRWERTIEIREVNKEKGRKGSKFNTKVFPKIQMNGVTMAMICFHLWDLIKCPFFDLERFSFVSSLSVLQLHYSNFKLIFRSGFPPVQQLCQWFSSCLARMSISLLQYWNLLLEDVQNTVVNNNIASTRFFKNYFHDSGCGGLSRKRFLHFYSPWIVYK